MGFVLGGFLKLLFVVWKIKVCPAETGALSPLTRRTSLEEDLYSRVVTAATFKVHFKFGCPLEEQGMLKPLSVGLKLVGSYLNIEVSRPIVWVPEFHLAIPSSK